MWLELEIYELFKDGFRLEVESYFAYGDPNTYKDEKLVRIYYVHRNKPKKQRSFCDAANAIISDREGMDEIEIKEAIADFIKTYPCLWHFKERLKQFEGLC